jgi:hypothetical protein
LLSIPYLKYWGTKMFQIWVYLYRPSQLNIPNLKNEHVRAGHDGAYLQSQHSRFCGRRTMSWSPPWTTLQDPVKKIKPKQKTSTKNWKSKML